MKKAQVQTQAFIYIFAIIVVSLILIVGVRAIFSFKKDTEKISLVNFQTDIKTRIAGVAAEYGSVEKVSILLPKEFKQVCFADKYTPYNFPGYTNYILINDLFNPVTRTSDNIFVLKTPTDFEQFKTSTPIELNPKGGFLCVNNTRGEIAFTLKGKGKYAEITP